MTSPQSWRSALNRARRQICKQSNPRTAFVGVGNTLRADDAIGMEIAQALKPLAKGRNDVLVIEAGVAPENQTGPLRRFAPDLVVFIDAADMGEQPGTIRWLDWRDTVGMSASTHTLPLHVLAEFLTKDLGCEVGLMGIQAGELGFGLPSGDGVVSTIDEIVQGITEIFLS